MADVLTFGRNRRFRIMAVADIHETAQCESRHDMEIWSDYLTLQNRALTTLKPNLVVLLGDSVSADNAEDYERVVSRVLAPFDDRKIPVAVVFGDTENKSAENVPFDEQVKIWQSFDICKILDKNSYSDEKGDYNLIVKNYDGDKDLLNLWFMNLCEKPDQKYNSYKPFATTEQIKWYEETVDKIAADHGGQPLPSIVFQHVPVPEEYLLLKKSFPGAFFGKSVKAIIPSRRGQYYAPDKTTDITGDLGEAPHVPDFNNGQFSSWKKKGDVFGAFFGNDHMNDFVGTVNGIVLGQCKLAGFGPYGDGLKQGVRIIDIYEDSPSVLNTRMCYYREIIGTNSISVRGFKKWMRDSYSITFYNSLRFISVAAAVTGTIIATRKYTEKFVVTKKK